MKVIYTLQPTLQVQVSGLYKIFASRKYFWFIFLAYLPNLLAQVYKYLSLHIFGIFEIMVLTVDRYIFNYLWQLVKKLCSFECTQYRKCKCQKSRFKVFIYYYWKYYLLLNTAFLEHNFLTLEVTTGPNSARAISADCAHGRNSAQLGMT